jgi:hypothetical protein
VSYADVLRSLNAPLIVRAAQAGADALDERPRLLATIAGLEHTVAAQAARIQELEGDRS